MNTIKNIYLVFALIIVFINANAQGENRDVTITASGSGKTLEEAKQSALRSATEQAFGAFISSKTEMFNDQVVVDQMASVSSGNIKSFEILNQDQLPDGRWGVTLKTTVSVDKLTSFVQAKGIDIEIKGGMFALNIKQQILNEQGEINSITEMIGLLHESMQVSFDYFIKSSDPKSIDTENKNWKIPLAVTATCNKNIDFCANYFIKTINSIALSENDIKTYKSLDKNIFSVDIYYSGKNRIYFLRNELSISAILSFCRNWEYYTRLFVVQSGINDFIGKGNSKYDSMGVRNEDYYEIVSKKGKGITIQFLTVGKTAAVFSWEDICTLAQIEQLTGYSVKPRGLTSKFRNGGYIIYESEGHGLVAALCDLKEMSFDEAESKCIEISLNGYNDWRLPTTNELQIIYRELFLERNGGLKNEPYLSGDESDYEGTTGVYFQGGARKSYIPNWKFDKPIKFNVRPVRVF
jgi:hypothetical protein